MEIEMFRYFMHKIFYYNNLAVFDNWAWQEFEQESVMKYHFLEDLVVNIGDYYYYNRDSFEIARSFDQWLREVKKEDDFPKYSFDKVRTRLSRNKLSPSARRNADSREFRICDDIYIVRDLFSFGFQTVPEGSIHVIVTSNRHLDLYKPRLRKPSLHYENGYIPSKKNIENEFYESVIPSRNLKMFESGEQYLIISPLKSFFYFKVYTDAEFYAAFGNRIRRI